MGSVTRTISGASTTITSSSNSTMVPAFTEPISLRVGFQLSEIPANCSTRIRAPDAPMRPLARTAGSFGGFALGVQLYCAKPTLAQITTSATTLNVRRRLRIADRLLEHRPQRVNRQLRRMSRGRRQATDLLHHCLFTDRAGFLNCLPCDHFCDQR